MKELELRFAADTVALLNENRIQLRDEYTVFISGYVSGESGTYGELYCAQWTKFMWECGTPTGTNGGDIIPEPFVGTHSADLDSYIATVVRVLNSEVAILHYAAMSIPYTIEFELRDPNTGAIFGVVEYDSTAKRYAFTAASDMVIYAP